MKRGNFDPQCNFVKGATVMIQKCLFVASAFMEINDWCLGLRIYMLLRPCLHCSDLKTSYKFGIFLEKLTFFYNSAYILNGTLLIIIFSYQDKRISNWFRIVSLDILILKKQQFSKFQKIDQSYLTGVLKVTPKLQSMLLIWKIYKHKNTLFFLFTHSPTCFSSQKRHQRNDSSFLFTIIILTLFILGVTLIDWSKLPQSKLPQVRLKLLQVQLKLPHLVGQLWLVFDSEYLQKTWSSLMEKEAIELKANFILFYMQ